MPRPKGAKKFSISHDICPTFTQGLDISRSPTAPGIQLPCGVPTRHPDAHTIHKQTPRDHSHTQYNTHHGRVAGESSEEGAQPSSHGWSARTSEPWRARPSNTDRCERKTLHTVTLIFLCEQRDRYIAISSVTYATAREARGESFSRYSRDICPRRP